MTKVLTEKEKIFIQKIVAGSTRTKAYLSMLEECGGSSAKRQSAGQGGARYYKKLKSDIKEAKKEERIDKKLSVVEKQEILEKKQDLLRDSKKESFENFLIVAKNPLLLSQTIAMAVLQAISTKIILSEDKRQIEHIEFDFENWEHLSHLKNIFSAGILNKEMFKAKVEQKSSPTVANQINVNVNK